jgi:hypothetical protein
MPKYKLAAQVTVSAYTTVEAPSEVAAVEIAEGRPVVIGGSGEDESESWIVDEVDGEAEHIHVCSSTPPP